MHHFGGIFGADMTTYITMVLPERQMLTAENLGFHFFFYKKPILLKTGNIKLGDDLHHHAERLQKYI